MGFWHMLRKFCGKNFLMPRARMGVVYGIQPYYSRNTAGSDGVGGSSRESVGHCGSVRNIVGFSETRGKIAECGRKPVISRDIVDVLGTSRETVGR